jgi:cytidylate kinase
MSDLAPPVIAIDGPSASGKGTVSEAVARRLGFHYLDSGVLYRVTGLAASDAGVALDDALGLAGLVARLEVRFDAGTVVLFGRDVTEAIREERISDAASRVAVVPAVRDGLLSRQRAWRKPPGLVADGRDMGTVVFPDATLRVYLTASPEARAERRYKQLIGKGMSASISTLLRDIHERDVRDAGRSVAPLAAGTGDAVLDTTNLSVEAAVEEVIRRYKAISRS